MNSQQYYRLSGRFSPLGVLSAVGISLAGTAVASVVYGYGISWIPLIYINILLVIGYAFVVGFLVGTGISVGKIRNRLVGALIGLLAGAFALYTAWVVWIFSQSSQEVLLLSPMDILAAMQFLAKEGVWSMKNITPTGWGLYIFWIAEAVIVVGWPVWSGFEAVSNNAFCERCECWMEDEKVLGLFHEPSDLRTLQNGLEACREDAVTGLRPIDPCQEAHSLATLETCPKCQDFRLLTLKKREFIPQKEGEPKISDSHLIRRLVVTQKLADSVTNRWMSRHQEARTEESTDADQG